MRWLHVLRFLLRPFRSRARVHREMEDELRFHLEMETMKLVQQGEAPEDAMRKARLRFGGVERIKEEIRDVDGVGWMEKLVTDLRFGLRVMGRNPLFAAVAILTLTLGIGAGTSIFSVVDGILLRPLPYPEPGRLVSLWADFSQRGGPAQEWLSYPNLQDARELDVFADLAAYGEWTPTLTGAGDAEMLQGAQFDQGMLSGVLRVAPTVGRGLTPADDRVGSPPVVLLSHELWTRRFGGDPGVLGSNLILDGVAREVIGIMPPGFTLPLLGGSFSSGPPAQDLWAPLQVDPSGPGAHRGEISFRAVGRLRDGVALEAAREQLDRLGARLQEAYPETNTGRSYTLLPLHKDIVRGAETGLWVLLGSVGFVFLLVCLNLANLILARGASRRDEMAVRTALGARRGRLIRQLVTETTLLALVGGILGMALSFGGTRLLVSLAPANTPRIGEVGVSLGILIFGMTAALASGIFVGLFPALRLSQVRLRRDLAQGGRGGGRTQGDRLRSALVAAQMAVALTLLVGAGLLLRSFQHLHQVDPGFEPRGVLSGYLTLDPERYSEAESRTEFATALEGRIRSLPGVRSVGVVSTLPLSRMNADTDFQIEGRPLPQAGEETISWIRRATPDYFQAMGIPVLEGRGFTPFDDRDQEGRVVIVNETLARRYFPGESAVGKRLNFNDPANPVWREIIGVVGDVKNFGIREGSQNATYFPFAQAPSFAFFLAVSTELDDPSILLPSLRSSLRELDPGVALSRAGLMEDFVAESLGQERFVAFLLSLFAGVALFLAAVGIYGVVAYAVSRRMGEISLRMALGAEAAAVGRMVVGRSLVLVGIGLAGGLTGALLLTRLLGSLLFGVEPTDPLVLAVTTGSLVLVALAASALPAWRAARADPAEALKAE